ncbi:MAG: substrate-binding domain-containing protein, partial [Ruminococcus sp.]|nr:substrate-binding domain-containing protein [Ruminococcus sp.]
KTEAESLGYDITFISGSMGKNRMSTYEHCKYRNVDGVIIACTDFTTQDVYEVVNGDIPIVTIDHIFDCRTAVMSNNEKGIEKLIEYVTNKGHTKLAYIQGNKSSVADKRLAGFCKACISRGINVNNDWLVQGDYHNPDKTYELTKKLLSDKDRPTCIFMPDDYSAIGGYNAIKDLGLSIPEDISVVGYDGINYSQLISPKLTTYSQDTTKIGKIAARQLIALIEDPQTTFTEVITVEGSLVEGDSVAQL